MWIDHLRHGDIAFRHQFEDDCGCPCGANSNPKPAHLSLSCSDAPQAVRGYTHVRPERVRRRPFRGVRIRKRDTADTVEQNPVADMDSVAPSMVMIEGGTPLLDEKSGCVGGVEAG